MIPAFLTTVLFSISAVTARRTTTLLDGTEANFWRLCVAACFLGAYGHLASYGLTGSTFPLLFISGCIGFGLGDLALFQTLPRLGSRLTVLLVHCLAAPLAATTEWVWLGTRLRGVEIAAAATILTGVALALAPSRQLNLDRMQFLPGLGFGAIAALGQAMGAVISRRAYEAAAAAGEPVDGITVAYQRILGGVLISGLWWLWIQRRSIRAHLDGEQRPTPHLAPDRFRRAWPWIVANGATGPALGVSCYQWALKSAPTGVVLPIVAITPLVVIPFACIAEGERPTARSLLGGFIAVLGVVLLAVA